MQLDHNRLGLGPLFLFLPLPPILRVGFLSIPAGTRLLPSIASVSLQRKLISFHVSTGLQYHTTVAIQSILSCNGFVYIDLLLCTIYRCISSTSIVLNSSCVSADVKLD
jgi:hypothetical protein